MSLDATSAPLTPPAAARPTGICIIRSEPIDGRRLYSITTSVDVLKPSARHRQWAGDVDAAMRIVASFLHETAQ